MGPEEIHPRVLKEVADTGARPLCIIFEKSWRSQCKKEIFYAENNQLLQQTPQGCGGVSFTGGFQDVIGQGARSSPLSSPSHGRLDWMTFQGPFKPGRFYDKVG